MKTLVGVLCAIGVLGGEQEQKPPFKVLPARAYHVLPGTHSDESGYFSLNEGLDGKMYVGTAKYNENAFLVEFDPKTGKQRIVLDTHQLCGLSAKGYAAQSKIHTRNFVGPSGKIYVGSKQGYRKQGDTSDYEGGYAMVYDPASGKAENLGMPFPGQGIADIVADEARGLLYVVTCEDQHWMLHDAKTRKFRELGPMLTPYATTLVDARGRANSITQDFKLARFDLATGKATTVEILVDGQVWTRPDRSSIPTWNLAADGRTAWLVLMNDVRLIKLDLGGADGAPVQATRVGTMVEGDKPDSRSALSIAPDGRVYVVASVENKTGFGKGRLHHLARFDPKSGKIEDLGVLTVKNPDFFNFGPGPDGKKPPWSHGYHTLPDGTLTPLHNHMALIMTKEGGAYVTIIAPFTLLRIEPAQLGGSPPAPGGSRSK